MARKIVAHAPKNGCTLTGEHACILTTGEPVPLVVGGHATKADAGQLLGTLLKDIVDNGAYNALGTGIVERLLEIKAVL